MNNGIVVWFTGLSGAGKTTLSQRLYEIISKQRNVEVLDGDEVRENLSKGLGFSKEDRDTNVLRIGYVAALLARNCVFVITAAISPYAGPRDKVRNTVEACSKFVEVYVKCDIDMLIKRDVKGLYKRALSGSIKNFTGIDDPYEEPIDPDIMVNSSIESVDESLDKILDWLARREWICLEREL